MARPFPNLRYFLKRGNKVVIADDGQSVEHVDGLESGETHQLLFVTFSTGIFYTGILREYPHRAYAGSRLHSSSAPW